MQTALTGGRRVTRSLLSARDHRVEIERGVSRKELSSACRDACRALDLRPVHRSVLIELVGQWRENPLRGMLIVWPSNEMLMQLTGLSERSIRNATKALTEAGVIAPRDSANGKRYARYDRSGELVEAYGFDLAPLQQRAGEFAALVEEQRREREARERKSEALTIARRGCQEALHALAEAVPSAPVEEFNERLAYLIRGLPRRGSLSPLDALVDEMQALRLDIEKAFNIPANAGTRCNHKESNNESPTEACSRELHEEAEPVLRTEQLVDIALLVDTCPAYADFGERIRTETDLVHVGKYLRGAIGAHESAWDEAVSSVGPVRAAAAVLFVLQLHVDDQTSGTNRILNPGGYFRALVRKIADRKFNIDAELYARRRRPSS